jgi:succinyl-CoA synthetase beta subunit
MNIHEYQAKSLLGGYGVPVPEGAVAYTPQEAERVAERLGGSGFAVKAQILAGARGPAGGVRLVATAADVRECAARMLGSSLQTPQTGGHAARVGRVYVERAVDPDRELYLGAVVDRARGRVALLGAREGGSRIEEGRQDCPVARLHVDPDQGLVSQQAAELAHGMGLAGDLAQRAVRTMAGVYDAFVALDASLIELNPLVITRGGELLALDAKMSFDDNALFRHKRIADLRDPDDEHALERGRHGYNYLELDGNIGCMVNGAGLAMATMDMIHHEGGRPANFLDVPPAASREQITAAFRTVLADARVDAALVNVVGGGITRCDVVADALASAVRASGRSLPLVVRFEGTNRDIARGSLRDRGIVFEAADSLAQAVARVVQLAGGRAS